MLALVGSLVPELVLVAVLAPVEYFVEVGLVWGAGLALDCSRVPEGLGWRAHRNSIQDLVDALPDGGVVHFALGTGYQ